MKKCPNCQAAYFDEMLEFCLEDGAKLTVVSSSGAIKTEPVVRNQKSVETMFFDASAGITPKTVEVRDSAATAVQSPANETKPLSLKENAVEKGSRALEISAIVFALAHNWWQWLYVDRQNYGSIANFLFSADFLIWFLLLLAGTAAGLLTLKLSRRKGMAYAGLVILAINFLLLLVPRK
jgi:hypothetical protein